MNIRTRLTAALVVVAATVSTAAVADPGRGRHDSHGHCPPGLAKKSPSCVPPGQARHQDHAAVRVGDRIGPGAFDHVANPGRYGLDQRAGWDYYRDGDRAYRVDRDTQRVLAVINLITAFTN
ncbi:MAG: hypothetical protein FJX25_14630 [Alphaproteobacteria bacterium]|nr:hypothetical protein [Alphaproteobacteria bacterium]